MLRERVIELMREAYQKGFEAGLTQAAERLPDSLLDQIGRSEPEPSIVTDDEVEQEEPLTKTESARRCILDMIEPGASRPRKEILNYCEAAGVDRHAVGNALKVLRDTGALSVPEKGVYARPDMHA